MTKYKAYVQKMLEENQKLFDDFRKLHNDYSLNPDTLQEKFNDDGKKILEVIHEYENRLCSNTERGMYNKFSEGLAEKFQNEVRKYFPKIDYIGLIVKPSSKSSPSVEFALKKINLS